MINRIITIQWFKSQFEENYECVDKFEVGVQNIGVNEERKLCSVAAQGDVFQCKLDVSDEKYCGEKYGFSVTAVNLNSARGVERLQTYANTILDVNCGDQAGSQAEKVNNY